MDDEMLSRITNPHDLGQSLKGRQLGVFQLEEFVGGGGMGAVFRARDTMLGRTVAVKVLSRPQSADNDSLQRFRNEAQSAARLDHENIARVHYVGEHDGWNYIVFEFIDGINLRDLILTKGPLSLDVAVSYTLQLAGALKHAVQREVVHRDIKPSNVLITASGRAKLVDMGLARLHQVEASQDDLTASGVTLGTFDYISPEQARDPRCADGRSDIYSLGCTFFFMLTGRPPFPEGTVLQKLLSHTSDDPPDLAQFRSDLPDEVTSIVHKMLEKRPEHRHQDPDELVVELLLLAERMGLASNGRTEMVWIAPSEARLPPIQRHLPWVVPVLLLFAIVLGLDWFRSPSEHRMDLDKIGPDSAEQTDAARTSQPRMVAQRDSESRLSPATVTPEGIGPGISDPGQIADNEEALPEADRHEGETEQLVSGEESSDATLESDAIGPSAGLGVEPSGIYGRLNVPEMSASIVAVERDFHETAAIGTATASSDERLDSTTGPNKGPTNRNVLVVGEDDGETDEPVFESLAAAVAYINNRQDPLSGLDVIELRFDGLREEPSFNLPVDKLTIRAGDGFVPVVQFQPQIELPSMVTLSGGEITWENVHFELILPPDDPVEHWALFGVEDLRLLQLNECTLTIRNDDQGRRAYHTDVAFFHVFPLPDNDGIEEAGVRETPLQIELQDCVVRGEATLVGVYEARPLRITWNNGLFATTERLLVAGGAMSAPRHGEHISVVLNHVTSVMDNGLCLLTSDDSAVQRLTVEIKCSNSILLTRSDAPLVDQRGPMEQEVMRGQVVFGGERNFFEHTGEEKPNYIYWAMRNSADPEQSVQLGFRDWTDYWRKENDNLWQEGFVEWRQLPVSTRPVHLLTIDDYRLNEHPANPARRYANDGRDAGCDIDRLPRLPEADSRVPRKNSRETAQDARTLK